MLDREDETQRIAVEPALDASMLALVGGLAGVGAGPRARAGQLGLTQVHRLDGRALLDPDGRWPRLVVVSSNRVRVVDLDEDLFPVEPVRERRRGPGEVVPLERAISRRDEPRDTRPASAPRSPPS